MALGREQSSPKLLFEAIRKAVPTTAGLVISTLPRGNIQIVQPMNVSDGLLKAYSRGFHAEDTLSWQAIARNKPLRTSDVWTDEQLRQSPYYNEWLKPQSLMFSVAVPVSGPILEGYPGVVHLCRTEEQGEFTPDELVTLAEAVTEYESKASSAIKKPSSSRSGAVIDRPINRLTIIDSQLKLKVPAAGWDDIDERLRNHMVDFSKRRTNQLNGHPIATDRILLPDSHGDHWTFRVMTYRSYPALGEGSFTFFCLQPEAAEWALVRPTDLNADAELARLVPSMKFMAENFAKGPTLVDIAKTVQLSPFHFHRRFTELLGLTPKQFLLECQINQAKVDLLSRDKELAQIAKDCGFAHQSHFTSRFKQASGLTPTRWRRMATERYVSTEN